MSPSAPASSHSDDESSVDLDEDGSEEQIAHEVPTSLAARFRNFRDTSPRLDPAPSPPPPPPPPPPPSSSNPTNAIHARSPRPNPCGPYMKIRPSQVKSCDHCRISKQKVHLFRRTHLYIRLTYYKIFTKCDRARQCSNCTMRRLKCTWEFSANTPEDTSAKPVSPSEAAIAARIAANRSEIARLNSEASILAKVLRLSPHEFAMFHLEAKRQAGIDQTHTRACPDQKRVRLSDAHYGRESKTSRRLDGQTSPRSSQSLPNCSPLRSSSQVPSSTNRQSRVESYRRREAELPTVRPYSSHLGRGSTATSPLRRAAGSPFTSTAASSGVNLPTIPSPPLPVSRNPFSALAPLKIPSPVVARPLPPHPARLAPPSSTTASPSRRPHYALPTPAYSSSSSSFASFFPVSSSTSKLSRSSRSLFPQYDSKSITSPRVQPYTPLSAVRDEKPSKHFAKEEEDDGDDDIIIVKFEPNPSLIPSKREAKASFSTVSSKTVTPSLRNLLDD